MLRCEVNRRNCIVPAVDDERDVVRKLVINCDSCGAAPTFGIVLISMVFVDKLINETLPSPELTTAARFKTGLIAIPAGLAPTGTVAIGAVFTRVLA